MNGNCFGLNAGYGLFKALYRVTTGEVWQYHLPLEYKYVNRKEWAQCFGVE